MDVGDPQVTELELECQRETVGGLRRLEILPAFGPTFPPIVRPREPIDLIVRI